MLARAALLADLRERAFRSPAPGAPPRLGAEVELIPVDAATGLQVPISAAGGPATLPLLRRHAARHGWIEASAASGAPQWRVPGAGIVSYEPGGQVELSADPQPSAGTLLHALRGTVLPLGAFLRDEGIELLSVGVEPRHPLSTVPLQLMGDRYRRLNAFLERIGTGGERMMRQTAAMQVSVDWGPRPALAWRVLNAMTPYVVAAFASSPCYAGEPTGHASTRATIWRALDGGRTGIFPGGDAAEEYLAFALAAPAILSPSPDFPPFERLLPGVTMADWHAHLTTLFPEVRPRGFAEVRSADAVDPAGYAAPLVLIGALVHHPPALDAAAELLGAPDPVLLETAGREGLSNSAIAATAAELAELALEAAARLPTLYPPEVVEEAAEFFARKAPPPGLAKPGHPPATPPPGLARLAHPPPKRLGEG